MSQTEIRTVEIPQGVTVNLQKKIIQVTGEKGKLLRDFSVAPVSINLEGSKIMISTTHSKRKTIALVGTVSSHIQNMVKGVTKGFTCKLKIVYSHFPISIKVEANKVIIENFMGERNPREAKIIGFTKVEVKGEDIIVQGINIEHVSQTAANIEQATRIKGRDPRKFLDGIYVYEK